MAKTRQKTELSADRVLLDLARTHPPACDCPICRAVPHLEKQEKKVTDLSYARILLRGLTAGASTEGPARIYCLYLNQPRGPKDKKPYGWPRFFLYLLAEELKWQAIAPPKLRGLSSARALFMLGLADPGAPDRDDGGLPRRVLDVLSELEKSERRRAVKAELRKLKNSFYVYYGRLLDDKFLSAIAPLRFECSAKKLAGS